MFILGLLLAQASCQRREIYLRELNVICTIYL